MKADSYVYDERECYQVVGTGSFPRQMDPPIVLEHICPQSAYGHDVDYDVSQEVTLQVPVEVVLKTGEHCCEMDLGSSQHCCGRHILMQLQRSH